MLLFSVLLLTLFYRFFKPIVEGGHVYAAQPPLFRIMHGKTRKYVLNEAELDEYMNKSIKEIHNALINNNVSVKDLYKNRVFI